MQSAAGIVPGWDQYTQDGSSFSQLPDEDFLTLLQKQFDENNSYEFYNNGGTQGINPQAIQPFVMQEFSSPSDSSPSPPSASSNHASNASARPQSSRRDSDDYTDDQPAHKRKASSEDMDDEPTTKTPHTATHNRKASASGIGPHRRKNNATSNEDNRLNKRKEQNRAAQRAFRERKEKHVKDLEDQVAALEAKNLLANSENVNLRDLLTRLQDENLQLKKQSFTFSVPKAQSSATSTSASSPSASTARSNSISSPLPLFANSPHSPISVSMPSSSSVTLPDNFTPDMDWSQLTNFDPAVLSLLDESPQMTATDTAMSMDFGFGNNDNLPFKSPFTTIAANPLFMSFSDFDTPSGNGPESSADANNFKFDTNNSWSSSISHMSASPQLDQLLSGDFMNQPSSVDFNTLMSASPSALSPIAHAQQPRHSVGFGNGTASGSGTSASSPSDSASQSTGATSVSGAESSMAAHSLKNCPKTREESKAFMLSQGSSVFVKGNVEKLPDGETVGCKGSTFPLTEPNASNVDLLTAWRKVTSDPKYKNVDVNSLCAEFTQKARCDGSKMVVEPHSLEEITKGLIANERKSS